MICSLGEEVESTLFSIRHTLHFAMALEDSTFVYGKNRGEQGSIDFTRGVDFHPCLGIYIPFHQAVDDDCVEPDFPFDDRCFTHD